MADVRRAPSTSIEDYACAVCSELLAQPCTLPCGHTFCLECVEHWIGEMHNSTCPLCRARIAMPYTPSLNVTLRNCISTMFPQDYERRMKQHGDRQMELRRQLLPFFFCRARECAGMLRELRGDTLLTDAKLETAMLLLPRGEFMPQQAREASACYSMSPTRLETLGFNISAPTVYTHCLQLLNLQPGQAFLDIGAGCGLLTALGAYLVGPQGIADGIDIQSRYLRIARRNCAVQQRRYDAMRAGVKRAASAVSTFGPASAMLAPGAVFFGHFRRATEETEVFLHIDARPSASEFDARLFWRSRDESLTLCRGRILSAASAGQPAASSSASSLGHASSSSSASGASPATLQLSMDETDLLSQDGRQPAVGIPATYTLQMTTERIWGNRRAPRTAAGTGYGAAAANDTQSGTIDMSLLRPASQVTPLFPDIKNVRFMLGNCFTWSPPAEILARGGYDRIHVGATCPQERTDALFRLLAPGGVLVTPIGHSLVKVVKARDGTITQTDTMSVLYGDLVLPTPESAAPDTGPTYVTLTLEPADTGQCVLFCKACGMPWVRQGSRYTNVVDLLGDELTLPDGPVSLCHQVENCVEDGSVYYHPTLLGARLQNIRCRGCMLPIGARFVEEPDERCSDEESFVGKCLIVKAYGRDQTSPQTSNEALIKCAHQGCGQIISTVEQYLSGDHQWTLQGSAVPAAYMNYVRTDSILLEPMATADMQQGRMDYSEMRCSKCRTVVGWKFLRYCDPAQRRQLSFYEGRYGLIYAHATNLPRPRPRSGLGSSRLDFMRVLQMLMNQGPDVA